MKKSSIVYIISLEDSGYTLTNKIRKKNNLYAHWYMYLVYMCAVFKDLCLCKPCMYCKRQFLRDLQIKFELWYN